MQRDRMLLLVTIVGVVLAAAVAVLVSPPLAAVPLLATGGAIVLLRRQSAGDRDWDDEYDEDDDLDIRSAEDDRSIDEYDGPADTFTTWQPEGGLSTWQPPAGTEAYVDEVANDYAAAAESWDGGSGFDAGGFGEQEYEPLPTWGTFVVGEVVEEVSSSDDILVASQQSALSVTEDLSEEEVQRVNQELLSRVHSLLAKYD